MTRKQKGTKDTQIKPSECLARRLLTNFPEVKTEPEESPNPEHGTPKLSQVTIPSWNDETSIEDFFRNILSKFQEDLIKEAIDTAQKLGVDVVDELKLLTENDLKDHFTLAVTRRVLQVLKKTAQQAPTQLDRIEESLNKLVVSNATVSFSNISICVWENDFLHLHLKRQDVKFKELQVDAYKDIKGFPWAEATADKQMARCLEWLVKWIPLPNILQFFDAHRFTKRYRIQVGEHTYKGGTDILITPIYASVEFQSAIAVIELKKPKDILHNRDQFIAQVEAELIAASNVSSFPVLAVLTDLNDYWFFTWFAAKGKIARCTCKSLREGMAILNQFVQTVEIPNPEEVSQELPERFSFPTCIAYKIPPSYSSPQPDVANELDLLDMVSPSDQMEILSRYALQQLSYYS